MVACAFNPRTPEAVAADLCAFETRQHGLQSKSRASRALLHKETLFRKKVNQNKNNNNNNKQVKQKQQTQKLMSMTTLLNRS